MSVITVRTNVFWLTTEQFAGARHCAAEGDGTSRAVRRTAAGTNGRNRVVT
jgi:hypothetical protein